MTSSNEDIFSVTGPLCGEFTGHRWIKWRGTLMFSLFCAWINGWVNNREAGDLRRHCAHYEVIVMQMEMNGSTIYSKADVSPVVFMRRYVQVSMMLKGINCSQRNWSYSLRCYDLIMEKNCRFYAAFTIIYLTKLFYIWTKIDSTSNVIQFTSPSKSYICNCLQACKHYPWKKRCHILFAANYAMNHG